MTGSGDKGPNSATSRSGSDAGESVKAAGGCEVRFDEVLGNADLEIGLDWTTTHARMVKRACARKQTG
jgi:hypothetical protein